MFLTWSTGFFAKQIASIASAEESEQWPSRPRPVWLEPRRFFVGPSPAPPPQFFSLCPAKTSLQAFCAEARYPISPKQVARCLGRLQLDLQKSNSSRSSGVSPREANVTMKSN
jgi:hypothetical protein